MLINKNIFEGGRLFGRGAYWKEGAKSNHYGNLICVSAKRNIIEQYNVIILILLQLFYFITVVKFVASNPS